MTIDQLIFSSGSQRPRTRPEQFVGLGIYLLISLGVALISRLTMSFLGTLYFLFLALAMWTLWRKYSLRVVKLELSLYLFQILWSGAYFAMEQSLLSLVAILLLWCANLLATLLFWKRDRFSGMLLIYPLVWIFYLVGVNMVACMSKV